MVLTPSSRVVTNNHVIEGATSITATDVGNHRTYQAMVAGYDQSQDIAVLQLAAASGLKTVTLGTSSAVKTGEKVLALSNAGRTGGTPAAATGIITALGQSITSVDEPAGIFEQLTGLIRINVPFQPGDSGGPLISPAGQVIGMDTAASSRLQITFGMAGAFAIPVSQAASIAAQIAAGKASATVHIGASARVRRTEGALPSQGHDTNASWGACAGPLTQTFIEQASVAHLNTSCLAAAPGPSLRLDPAMNRATRRSAKAEIRLDVEESEMPKITDDRPAHIDSDAPADNGQLARQQAIQQIRARRRFKISTASAAVGVTLPVPIWAATEYRNAGGWPPWPLSPRPELSPVR